MFYRLIFLFNILVTMAAAGLAAYGLFLAIVPGHYLIAIAYYVLALVVRTAFVDLPDPDQPTPTR